MLFRQAVPVALAVGAVAVLVAVVAAGPAAGFAAVLGLAMVVGFFGIDLLTLRLTASAAPATSVGLLMIEYVAKVAVFAAFLWWLREKTAVDLPVLAATVVVITVTFVAALTTAAIRTRSFSLDPSDQA